MIGHLTGTLLEKNPPHALIDCGGTGDKACVPESTHYGLLREAPAFCGML